MKPLWLLPCLLAAPAWAGCAGTPLELWVALPANLAHGQTGAVRLGLDDLPPTDPACGKPAPVAADAATDILHGAQAPKGLLRGDGPRDVLHMVRDGHVTLQPAQSP